MYKLYANKHGTYDVTAGLDSLHLQHLVIKIIILQHSIYQYYRFIWNQIMVSLTSISITDAQNMIHFTNQ